MLRRQAPRVFLRSVLRLRSPQPLQPGSSFALHCLALLCIAWRAPGPPTGRLSELDVPRRSAELTWSYSRDLVRPEGCRGTRAAAAGGEDQRDLTQDCLDLNKRYIYIIDI